MRRHDQSRLLLLLALSLATFLPWVGRRDIVTSHEARVVQTARQMAESGWPWNAALVAVPRSELVETPQGERLAPRADGAAMLVNPWIVPVMNGQIRLQKPPLPYWCAAVLYRLFGVSEFTTRIVPALLGALSVLLVWDFARNLLGRVGAIYAALVWISSYFIVDEFRKAMADPYLAFFTLLAICAWLRARRLERRWYLLFYLALALGILAKGPIIFLFVSVIVLAYEWTYWHKQKIEFRSSVLWPHVFGVTLLLAITLPWAIGVRYSVPNVLELWRFESLGALSDKSDNARPFWFYLPNLFLITLPWTPIWIMGLILPFRFPRKGRFFAAVSTATLVVCFSIPFPKKNAYLLPLMPLQALIVAEGLRWLTLLPRRRAAPTAIGRTAITAVTFSIAIQVFLSGFTAAKENRRSPRSAAAYAQQLAAQSDGQLSLLMSEMPDEVTVYLPLHPSESKTASAFLLIADNRSGLAESTARAITATPGGPVIAIEPLALSDSTVSRWKLYRLNVLPIQRPAPGAG